MATRITVHNRKGILVADTCGYGFIPVLELERDEIADGVLIMPTARSLAAADVTHFGVPGDEPDRHFLIHDILSYCSDLRCPKLCESYEPISFD